MESVSVRNQRACTTFQEDSTDREIDACSNTTEKLYNFEEAEAYLQCTKEELDQIFAIERVKNSSSFSPNSAKPEQNRASLWLLDLASEELMVETENCGEFYVQNLIKGWIKNKKGLSYYLGDKIFNLKSTETYPPPLLPQTKIDARLPRKGEPSHPNNTFKKCLIFIFFNCFCFLVFCLYKKLL